MSIKTFNLSKLKKDIIFMEKIIRNDKIGYENIGGSIASYEWKISKKKYSFYI